MKAGRPGHLTIQQAIEAGNVHGGRMALYYSYIRANNGWIAGSTLRWQYHGFHPGAYKVRVTALKRWQHHRLRNELARELGRLRFNRSKENGDITTANELLYSIVALLLPKKNSIVTLYDKFFAGTWLELALASISSSAQFPRYERRFKNSFQPWAHKSTILLIQERSLEYALAFDTCLQGIVWCSTYSYWCFETCTPTVHRVSMIAMQSR